MEMLLITSLVLRGMESDLNKKRHKFNHLIIIIILASQSSQVIIAFYLNPNTYTLPCNERKRERETEKK